jgi:hypothetical protein
VVCRASGSCSRLTYYPHGPPYSDLVLPVILISGFLTCQDQCLNLSQTFVQVRPQVRHWF